MTWATIKNGLQPRGNSVEKSICEIIEGNTWKTQPFTLGGTSVWHFRYDSDTGLASTPLHTDTYPPTLGTLLKIGSREEAIKSHWLSVAEPAVDSLRKLVAQ